MRPAYWLWATLALAAIFAANIVLAGQGNEQRLASFVITVLALVVLLSLIGREIKQRPGGILIDDRNRISLSKLQIVMWTVLIIGGLITAAAIRMHHGQPGLDVTIEPELLIVMGISAGSLVATPAILSLKAAKPPVMDDVLSATEVGDVASVGLVHGRPAPEQAAWADIFRGDEVGNANAPDLGKIQQFLITGLLVSYYAILLGQMAWFGAAGPPEAAGGPADGPSVKRGLEALPSFDESMVWLLGISHAGYLGYKAAPHTATASASTLVGEVG